MLEIQQILFVVFVLTTFQAKILADDVKCQNGFKHAPEHGCTKYDEAAAFPCPAGVPQVYVQHPEDCNAFYLCRSGEFQGIFNCPADLWFSTELQGCVSPDESDCLILETTKQPQTDVPPVTTTTTNQPPIPTTDSPIETTSADKFPCPAGVPNIYVQHPNDCNAFYLCRNGEFLGIFNCPAGLWFSSERQECVYPEESDCSVGGTSKPPLTENPQTTNRPPIPTTDAPVETTSSDRFPCPAGIPQIYVQHPDDCNAFYLCRNGEFLGIFSCPAGLWFSSERQECVYPEDSDCTVGGTTKPPVTGNPPTTTRTTSRPPIPTTDSPIETTVADRFPCPAGVPNVYVQHPDDCNAFYLCRNGEFLGIFICPPGLWFSSERQECVYPEDSDCTVGGTTKPPVTENPPTTTTTTNRPPIPTTDSQVETTSADGLPCPAGVPQVYVQHPDDCNAFYLCRNGIFLGIFNCPSGLWFSTVLQGCVKPEESDCMQ